jgi:hypothetical protein
MVRGYNLPWVGGSNYHEKGVQYTMGMGDQNTMGRIPIQYDISPLSRVKFKIFNLTLLSGEIS